MPFPGSNRSLLSKSNGLLLDGSSDPIPADQMPVKFTIFFPLFDDTPRIFQYRDDIERAMNVWRPHLPSVTLKSAICYVNGGTGIPECDVFHFNMHFVDVIPPNIADGHSLFETIAQTSWTLPYKPEKRHGYVIFLNSVKWSASGKDAGGEEEDFVSTCAHELGHALGIHFHTGDPGHPGDSNDVMWPSKQVGQIVHQLSANDIAALKTVYPDAKAHDGRPRGLGSYLRRS